MANVGHDIGSFFKSLGEGITSTISGVGASLHSGAAYNNAIANQINANAATAAARLRAQEAQQSREQRLLIFVFLIVVAAPLIGFAIIKK